MLKIIDAHLHFVSEPYFDQIARAAGHENSEQHLHREYARLGIVHGIVMGNHSLLHERAAYPEKLSYCVGIDTMGNTTAAISELAKSAAQHLQRPDCVGIKLYPGYHHFYVYDHMLEPLYALAAQYGKPVAVHTGLTASRDAVLKYSHPLTLDEAAATHPDVQFVMCHIGNPWLNDAVAVLEKNHNVSADLSGLLEGYIEDMSDFCRRKHRYINMMAGWFEYLEAYDRLMFGTDWPLANLENYIAFTKAIIPPAHWENVFFSNANRIYQLGL